MPSMSGLHSSRRLPLSFSRDLSPSSLALQAIPLYRADGQTLHLKASSAADTQGEQQRAGEGASITSAATVDLSTADSEASVDLEVLTRYASTGFKFAAKMLLKSSLGNTDPMAVKVTTEG